MRSSADETTGIFYQAQYTQNVVRYIRVLSHIFDVWLERKGICISNKLFRLSGGEPMGLPRRADDQRDQTFVMQMDTLIPALYFESGGKFIGQLSMKN